MRCWLGLAVALGVVLSGHSLAEADPFQACVEAPPRHTPAVERIVAINTPDGNIAGTLAQPVGIKPQLIALLLHGYTGSRNEIRVAKGEGMFARTARAFAERGIATLRIDFIGSWASDGEWADTTFSTQARDAVRAAAALRDDFGFENIPVGVLGYSQGGLVSLRAATLGALFDAIALWNPVMDPMATYSIIFGREKILEAAKRHDPGNSGAIVEGTRLRPGFFAEITTSEPIADGAKIAAPVFMVTGQRDPLVKNGTGLAANLAAGRAADTVILDINAGHDLGALREPDLLDDVIACTAGFLLSATGN